VHLLGSQRWPLHYTFIREQIDDEPALDRCDPEQARQFDAGWYAFSQTQYWVAQGRRYLLGTLVRYASGLQAVEYTPGDAIDPEQMKRGFFAVMRRVPDPRAWSLRPADAHQLAFMRQIEGSVPIVSTNAPFIGVDYQPLTQAVGYGTLRFVPSAELASAEIGPHVIVVTDDVPNGIPLVGGLVTEAFQTPLAHVNVLSQARGTPNMALRGAHADPRFKPLFGKLVRLEVGAADVTLRAASADEADAFWRAHAATGEPVVPPLDDSVRGMVELPGRGLEDLPAVGAKAAQLAELYRVSERRPNQGCPPDTVPLHVPRDAFAVPVAYYLDHFAATRACASAAAATPRICLRSTAPACTPRPAWSWTIRISASPTACARSGRACGTRARSTSASSGTSISSARRWACSSTSPNKARRRKASASAATCSISRAWTSSTSMRRSAKPASPTLPPPWSPSSCCTRFRRARRSSATRR
jgi:hypothetical protein